MHDKTTLTFYSYALEVHIGENRWSDRALPGIFFDDFDAARREVLELRREIAADPEGEWQDICLEKIETVPMNGAAILALLNNGVEAIIKDYEIIETIGKD